MGKKSTLDTPPVFDEANVIVDEKPVFDEKNLIDQPTEEIPTVTQDPQEAERNLVDTDTKEVKATKGQEDLQATTGHKNYFTPLQSEQVLSGVPDAPSSPSYTPTQRSYIEGTIDLFKENPVFTNEKTAEKAREKYFNSLPKGLEYLKTAVNDEMAVRNINDVISAPIVSAVEGVKSGVPKIVHGTGKLLQGAFEDKGKYVKEGAAEAGAGVVEAGIPIASALSPAGAAAYSAFMAGDKALELASPKAHEVVNQFLASSSYDLQKKAEKTGIEPTEHEQNIASLKDFAKQALFFGLLHLNIKEGKFVAKDLASKKLTPEIAKDIEAKIESRTPEQLQELADAPKKPEIINNIVQKQDIENEGKKLPENHPLHQALADEHAKVSEKIDKGIDKHIEEITPEVIRQSDINLLNQEKEEIAKIYDTLGSTGKAVADTRLKQIEEQLNPKTDEKSSQEKSGEGIETETKNEILKDSPQESEVSKVSGETKGVTPEPLLNEEKPIESIFDLKTDLKGNKKEAWMHKATEREAEKVGKQYKTMRGSQFYPKKIRAIESAIENNKFQKAIEEGKISESDAKEIIESIGAEVPKDLTAKPEETAKAKESADQTAKDYGYESRHELLGKFKKENAEEAKKIETEKGRELHVQDLTEEQLDGVRKPTEADFKEKTQRVVKEKIEKIEKEKIPSVTKKKVNKKQATISQESINKFVEERANPQNEYKRTENIIEDIAGEDKTEQFVKGFAESELPKKQFNKKYKIDVEKLPDENIDVRPIEQKVKFEKKTTTSDKTKTLKNIIGEDELRPMMSGVHYDAEAKALIATDAHKLVIIPDKSITKTETKTIDGKRVLDGRYPNYKAVVPDIKEMPFREKINVQEWLNETNGLARTESFFTSAIKAKIKIGDIEFGFEPKLLNDVLKTFAENGVKEVEMFLELPNRAMILKGDGITGLLMPIMMDGGEKPLVSKTILERDLTAKEVTAKEQADYLRERRSLENDVERSESYIKGYEKDLKDNKYENENWVKEWIGEEQDKIKKAKKSLKELEDGRRKISTTSESVQTVSEPELTESQVADIESKAESGNETELTQAIEQADELIKPKKQKTNATKEIKEPSSVQEQREGGNQSGETAKTGSSNSVLGEKKSGEEKITPKEEVKPEPTKAEGTGKKLADKIRAFADKREIKLYDENGKEINLTKLGSKLSDKDILYKIADLVEKGGELIDHIKTVLGEQDWYNNLTAKGKAAVELQIENRFLEEKMMEGIKQRHLPEDWVKEIKSRIPKGSEPREVEVFKQVADDFKENKISENQIEDSQNRLINNEKSDLKDVAIIFANKIRLKAIEDGIRDKIADIKKEDIYGREALEQELESVKAKQYKNTEAAVMAGRERFAFTGRLLASEAEEDFTIHKTLSDMEKANINKVDISDLKKEVEGLTKKLEESDKKIRDLQKKKPKPEYNAKEVSEIDQWNKKAKEAIDKIFEFGKIDLPEGTQKLGFGSEEVKHILYKAVDGITEAVKAGKAVAEAIKEQIDKFKESDFYKSLTKDDQSDHEKKFEAILNNAFTTTSKSAELKSAYEKALERAIGKNEEKIDNIKKGIKEPDKPDRLLSAREKELVDRNNKLKEELEKLRKQDTVRASEIRKKSKETRIFNENPKLRQQLEDIERTGDYTIPEKPNTPISKDAERTRLENEDLRDKILVAKAKVDFRNQSAGEKGLYYAKKILRFAILSGIKSLGKIGELALARPLTSVPDAVMAESFGKVFKSLAEESPTYNPIGMRETMKLEYNAFKGGYENYVNNLVNVLKTGKSDVDLKYGKGNKQAKEYNKVLDFWQSFHKILKEPTRKTGAIKGAFRAQRYAIEHGMDLTDPETQTMIASVAKNFGDRQVLLQDNRVTDILASLQEKTEKFNKVAGAVLYSKKPITKVPPNFIGESLERIFGLPRSAGKSILNIHIPATTKYIKGLAGKGERVTYGQAIKKTISKLGETEEGRKKIDSVIRNFSYGGTTAFYFGVAYVLHKELKPILDALPNWAKHIPQFAPLFIGTETGEQNETHGFLESAANASATETKELVKGTPLLSEIIYNAPRTIRGIFTKKEDKKGLQKTIDFLSDEAGQEIGAYNPQLIQQIAQWQFPEARYGKGFVQQIEEGVPYLRENVPIKSSRSRNRNRGGR